MQFSTEIFIFLLCSRPMSTSMSTSFRSITMFATKSMRPVNFRFDRKNGKIIMKNIETSVFPLLFVLCVCGLYVFEYPQGRPRLYFTILYILTSWLLYIYIFVKTKMFINKFFVNFPPVLYFITIVAFMFMLFNIYYHEV